MAKWRYELDTRVLALFFLVAMPFVAVGSFIVVRMARVALRDSIGAGIEQRAIETKLLVERYVGGNVVQLRLLSLEPTVREALAKSPPEPRGDELKRLEQAWAGGEAKLLASVTANRVGGRMRDIITVNPGFRLLQLVDARGRLLATSARGGRVWNAEAPWFKGVLAAEGRAWMSDIQRPPGSTVAFFEIAYPVTDPADGRWLGAIRAVVDPLDLYAVLAPVRVGRTGHAVLLRASDGTVLASDETDRVLTAKFPGFRFLEAARNERRGYWITDEIRETVAPDTAPVLIEPARIVAWSPVDQVPDVQWLVTVEQELNEALAPINGVTGYLWVHFIGVFATVILLAAYFSFKLEKPVIEEDLHLHEEHVPKAAKVSEG
jgi:hypothetical protein